MTTRLLHSAFPVWIVLALPAAVMLWPLAFEGAEWRSAIRPSGDFAAKLIVLALLVSPLRAIFPRAAFVQWIVRRRRWLGVAAFSYLALHAAAFSLSIGRLDWIVEGLAFPSMWTGWAAFALLVPLALTSSDRAMRLLGRWWKRLHRLIYPAALLILAHWLLLTPGPGEALLHALPLLVLEAWRVALHVRRRVEVA